MVVKVWKSKRKLSPIWTLNGPQAPLGVICNILGIQQPQLTPAQQQISASQSLYRIFIFVFDNIFFHAYIFWQKHVNCVVKCQDLKLHQAHLDYFFSRAGKLRIEKITCLWVLTVGWYLDCIVFISHKLIL